MKVINSAWLTRRTVQRPLCFACRSASDPKPVARFTHLPCLMTKRRGIGRDGAVMAEAQRERGKWEGSRSRLEEGMTNRGRKEGRFGPTNTLGNGSVRRWPWAAVCR